MTTVELLRKEAEIAFADLLLSIEGLDEKRAWGRLEGSSEEYLNTDGSVQGMMLHVACCKKAYGSFAFRDCELRWRDLATEIEPEEATWNSAKDYLLKAQEYWLASWDNLADAELEQEVLHFSGKMWPAWKIITTVTHHDQYHAGQIAIVRFAGKPSDVPPPTTAEDIRTYCKDLPTW